ncbi:MAG: hypothetical protein JWO57_889 [Pseudonocardiales bacterium]|nr:hypothetical protein [Pseudonocardiales bacterium]
MTADDCQDDMNDGFASQRDGDSSESAVAPTPDRVDEIYSARLSDFLITLRSLGSGPPPPPSAELSAILTATGPRHARPGRIRRHRRVVAGVVFVGAMGAGLTGVAAAAGNHAGKSSTDVARPNTTPHQVAPLNPVYAGIPARTPMPSAPHPQPPVAAPPVTPSRPSHATPAETADETTPGTAHETTPETTHETAPETPQPRESDNRRESDSASPHPEPHTPDPRIGD